LCRGPDAVDVSNIGMDGFRLSTTFCCGILAHSPKDHAKTGEESLHHVAHVMCIMCATMAKMARRCQHLFFNRRLSLARMYACMCWQTFGALSNIILIED